MRLLTPFAALLLAACVSAPKPGAPLRVMTYNIHAGKDAGGAENLERVAAVIASSAADVVLLQEVDRGTARSGNVDQLAVLERLTGFHGAFGKSLDYQGGDYGIATLSRWPISNARTVHLPVDPPQVRAGGSHEPRVALIVETKGLHVINTHLDASRDDHYRLQEAAQVRELVGKERSPHVIAGGDFNSTPDSGVHEQMLASGLQDCGSGATYPAEAPAKRIDYLYCAAAFRCAAAEVVETNASDHRPVVARFEWDE